MKLDDLGRKLQQELARNKRKSAILGVVFLVAIYFWCPLIWKWCGGTRDEDASVVVAESSTAPPVLAIGGGVPAANGNDKQMHWTDMLAMYQRTVGSGVFDWQELPRNPFRAITTTPVVDEEPAPEPEPVVEPQPPREFAPGDVGLVLNSTFIGTRYKIARISGNVFREGTLVRAAGLAGAVDDPSLTGIAPADSVEYRLEEIHPQHVVLRRGDQTYALRIHRMELTGTNRRLNSPPAIEQ